MLSSLAEQTSDADFYLQEILVLARRREAERWNKPDIFSPACVGCSAVWRSKSSAADHRLKA